MAEEKERPYICLKCGWRSFKYPNVHTCTEKWPIYPEDYDKRWEEEIANDPRMKDWIAYITKKFS